MVDQKNKTIAIIPARAGSKRLPGKNHKLLADIPLFMHSINYAKLNAHIIDEVMVSTNDSEIKALAFAENIQVIDRPESISGDNAPTLSVLKHVLKNLEENVKNIILLQPTNPLRPEDLLNECWKTFIDRECTSLFTVSQSSLKLGKIQNQEFVPFNYQFGQRSQDIEPLYYENGLLYIAKAEMIEKGELMNEASFPFIVDHPFATVDIDEQSDFDYAEFLFQKYKSLE